MILIAERFRMRGAQGFTARWMTKLQEMEHLPFREAMKVADHWLDVSCDLGAFRKGRGQARLQSLGLEPDKWCNLLPPSPKSGEWDWRLAEEIAQRWKLLVGHERVVLCGVRVGRAWLRKSCRLLQHDEQCIVVPHPSGRSRFWNDEERIVDAELEIEEWLQNTVS